MPTQMPARPRQTARKIAVKGPEPVRRARLDVDRDREVRAGDVRDEDFEDLDEADRPLLDRVELDLDELVRDELDRELDGRVRVAPRGEDEAMT